MNLIDKIIVTTALPSHALLILHMKIMCTISHNQALLFSLHVAINREKLSVKYIGPVMTTDCVEALP